MRSIGWIIQLSAERVIYKLLFALYSIINHGIRGASLGFFTGFPERPPAPPPGQDPAGWHFVVIVIVIAIPVGCSDILLPWPFHWIIRSACECQMLPGRILARILARIPAEVGSVL